MPRKSSAAHQIPSCPTGAWVVCQGRGTAVDKFTGVTVAGRGSGLVGGARSGCGCGWGSGLVGGARSGCGCGWGSHTAVAVGRGCGWGSLTAVVVTRRWTGLTAVAVVVTDTEGVADGSSVIAGSGTVKVHASKFVCAHPSALSTACNSSQSPAGVWARGMRLSERPTTVTTPDSASGPVRKTTRLLSSRSLHCPDELTGAAVITATVGGGSSGALVSWMVGGSSAGAAVT